MWKLEIVTQSKRKWDWRQAGSNYSKLSTLSWWYLKPLQVLHAHIKHPKTLWGAIHLSQLNWICIVAPRVLTQFAVCDHRKALKGSTGDQKRESWTQKSMYLSSLLCVTVSLCNIQRRYLNLFDLCCDKEGGSEDEEKEAEFANSRRDIANANFCLQLWTKPIKAQISLKQIFRCASISSRDSLAFKLSLSE